MLREIINIINPNNKNIEEMSKEEFFELLVKLNQCLRCLGQSENVLEENMSAGDLVSPTKEVQIKTLEYLTESLSKVQDKKAKAAMVYYTLLNLHMFRDGNGRTSIFMYDLISGDLSEDNISYYFHKDSNYTRKQENDLEGSKGIMDISTVNQIPDEFIGKQLGFIPEEILANYSWITVGHTDSSPSTDSIIPKSVLNQLGEKELQELDKVLQDGYGMLLCPSGLAMLYVANKKGQLNEWINLNNDLLSQGIGIPGRLNFSVYRNPNMIADWTVDDFREIIRVANIVKYARLKCQIDLFVEPEKYVDINSGDTYMTEILNASEEKVDGITI